MDESTQNKILEYISDDPLLARMTAALQKAGKIKSSMVDITNRCNLRCRGCYFFDQDFDRHNEDRDNSLFETFIENERSRGTNLFTVLGGEPSLRLDRLKMIYDNFWTIVTTNGLVKIPYEGFEKLAIAISVWGDHETDKELRGGGKTDVFQRGLENYHNDNRVLWYYTTMSGKADDIESVTEQVVANGNLIGYNFYGDLSHLGGDYDHTKGFAEVEKKIDEMILKYPNRVLNTAYNNRIIRKGKLYDETWGYDVCPSITYDHETNRERIKNGYFYNRHFRAYNSDFKTTRRCCIGNDRDCSTCYDLWAHGAWITANVKKHLGSKQDFINWLAIAYIIYLTARVIDFDEGIELLPEIHQRSCSQVINGHSIS